MGLAEKLLQQLAPEGGLAASACGIPVWRNAGCGGAGMGQAAIQGGRELDRVELMQPNRIRTRPKSWSIAGDLYLLANRPPRGNGVISVVQGLLVLVLLIDPLRRVSFFWK